MKFNPPAVTLAVVAALANLVTAEHDGLDCSASVSAYIFSCLLIFLNNSIDY